MIKQIPLDDIVKMDRLEFGGNIINKIKLSNHSFVYVNQILSITSDREMRVRQNEACLYLQDKQIALN